MALWGEGSQSGAVAGLLAREARSLPSPSTAALLELLGERTESAVRLAYHFTRDREAALDLSQEAFVRALQSLDSLDDPARLGAWFQTIVVNLCRDWIRRRVTERRALAGVAAMPPDSVPDPAQGSERNEEAGRVQRALLELPSEYREVVALVCVEGMSCRDAAKTLGAPEGTLRWRLHEARAMLRKKLGFPERREEREEGQA
jgi:RNA polymerase sigma-70 factor (ECF subfamily)